MGVSSSKEKSSSFSKTVSTISNIGQTFWTVIVGAGVFFATLYSTQSVVNTRLQYIEGEIRGLHSTDEKFALDMQRISSQQSSLLLDISNRIREMEIKLTELQVKVLYAIDRKDSSPMRSIVPSMEAPK
jgi:hypothetical protein